MYWCFSLNTKAQSVVRSSALGILLAQNTPRRLQDCVLILLICVLKWPSEPKAWAEVLTNLITREVQSAVRTTYSDGHKRTVVKDREKLEPLGAIPGEYNVRKLLCYVTNLLVPQTAYMFQQFPSVGFYPTNTETSVILTCLIRYMFIGGNNPDTWIPIENMVHL